MKTIAACVPTSHVCPHINRAFRKFGLKARAFTRRPTIHDNEPLLVEHLPCPIEPTSKASLWIVVKEQDVDAFLGNTFLNESFVQTIVASTGDVEDTLAMECLMAACAARSVTQKSCGAKNMYQTALTQGSNSAWQHLAECVLGIPSLKDLLVEFVESVVAGSPQYHCTA